MWEITADENLFSTLKNKLLDEFEIGDQTFCIYRKQKGGFFN